MISEFGMINQATIKNDAEEKSPTISYEELEVRLEVNNFI